MDGSDECLRREHVPGDLVGDCAHLRQILAEFLQHLHGQVGVVLCSLGLPYHLGQVLGQLFDLVKFSLFSFQSSLLYGGNKIALSSSLFLFFGLSTHLLGIFNLHDESSGREAYEAVEEHDDEEPQDGTVREEAEGPAAARDLLVLLLIVKLVKGHLVVEDVLLEVLVLGDRGHGTVGERLRGLYLGLPFPNAELEVIFLGDRARKVRVEVRVVGGVGGRMMVQGDNCQGCVMAPRLFWSWPVAEAP